MTRNDPTASPRPAADNAGWGVGIADPGPLGLAAFALTTFVLSVFNSGMIKTGEGVVLGLALAYGGLAQLLAGMWEFTKGNTFGATAFASFGAFWISFWWLIEHAATYAKGSAGNDFNHALGVYLLAWAIFTAYMTVASLRVSGAVAAVFVFLTLTFLFLAIGKLTQSATATDSTGLYKFGGWLGLITALLAWYASFAGVVNSTFKRVVLPVVPLTEGRTKR
jgi:succinate-acetate transporter protein